MFSTAAGRLYHVSANVATYGCVITRAHDSARRGTGIIYALPPALLRLGWLLGWVLAAARFLRCRLWAVAVAFG